MTEDMILLEKSDGVARITLNRPDMRNAFNDVLISELHAMLVDMEQDSSVRAVVLAGNGPAFCAGADLGWMKRMAGYEHAQNLADAQALADMLASLHRMQKPTIARVHGAAFAGGVGLVAACDMAVGSLDARFCFSEVRLGLSPATISPYVLRAIGERAARRYFLTAEVFDATEAHRLGLLSALVPPDALDAATDTLVQHLVAGGPQALAKIKDLVEAVSGQPVNEALSVDTAQRIADIRVSPEGREGIASFLEKRKPSWTFAS
ncbi:enoyl-CoA hydratase [Burkholderiaceae bacterium 16]|nr:enoyl-CoA hydratase [Burkholderiaceae bacterium 16]